jgi:hypothetical protein
VSNAHAAFEALDGEGHTVPVIVLDVESDQRHAHAAAHQAGLPTRAHGQAEAAARRYRKGQRVTVQASALSVRLACVAEHIHTHKENETEQ